MRRKRSSTPNSRRLRLLSPRCRGRDQPPQNCFEPRQCARQQRPQSGVRQGALRAQRAASRA
jgi:hypothetical protein